MNLLIVALIGLFAGILSGLLGIGGGILIIPALTLLVGLDQKTAQGTSLALLVIPVVLAAFINYYKNGFVNLQYAIALILSFPIGAYIGSTWAILIDSYILKKAFAIFLVIVALYMLLEK
ncbi:MAG: TSUP family transporter [bacterium]